ncbi:MAG TPA: class I SAM-dependent methyltransferase [Acidimicrobiales bacterium]|nr:class I SAM-dependent methyltransferase [Acidimicrobiales bacterium]
MLAESVDRILSLLRDGDRVLDVGAWAKPFLRADAVLDINPYETRGAFGSDGPGPERFSRDSWVQLDICGRQAWPFADGEFDFVVCSHTLEDVRDPVWVCSELVRIAKAGYIETPSRLEEQSFGFQGPWVGWGHHHWLVDSSEGHLDFVFKHHVVHGRSDNQFPLGFRDRLSERERVLPFFWVDSFTFCERHFDRPEELDSYLATFVAEEKARRHWKDPAPAPAGAVRRVMDRLEAARSGRIGPR